MNKLPPPVLLGVCVVGLAIAVRAQGPQPDQAPAQLPDEATGSPLVDGIESSFSFPWRDWLRPRDDGKKEHPLRGFSIAPSFNLPLFSMPVPGVQGIGNQGQQESATPTVTVSVKYNPITYWFAATTFYGYLSPRKQQPWNPDFSYSFGYDDWHPYTFSLTYSNYGGNRFHPNRSAGQPSTVVPDGTYALGWKFHLPQRIEDQLKLTDTSTMGWSVAYNLTPRYIDSKTLATMHWKQGLTLSYTNTVYKFFYWNVTLYAYPIASEEQPWNPDFTYGFGYFDYRPGKFSIEYNNYSGNRFPWKKSSPGTGKFTNGGISVMWSWAWPQ